MREGGRWTQRKYPVWLCDGDKVDGTRFKAAEKNRTWTLRIHACVCVRSWTKPDCVSSTQGATAVSGRHTMCGRQRLIFGMVALLLQGHAQSFLGFGRAAEDEAENLQLWTLRPDRWRNVTDTEKSVHHSLALVSSYQSKHFLLPGRHPGFSNRIIRRHSDYPLCLKLHSYLRLPRCKPSCLLDVSEENRWFEVAFHWPHANICPFSCQHLWTPVQVQGQTSRSPAQALW